MAKQGYANIEWTVNDVLQNSKQFGIPIARDEAKEILIKEERHIVDAMLTAGWQVIEDALLQR